MKYLIATLLFFSTIYMVNAKSTILTNAKDTTIISNKNVEYKISENQSNLYLHVSTSDIETVMSMLHLGITVYFDTKGRKKQNVSIKYPIQSKRPNAKQRENTSKGFKDFEHDSVLRQKIAEVINKGLPQEGEYKYFGTKEKFHILLNTLNVAVSYTYNATNGLLEYDLVIPKNKISKDSEIDLSKLMIGVKTNTIKKNKEDAERPNISLGGRGSGGQGGPPGGGQGQGGQRNGPPKTNKNVKPTEVVLDFWFKANLL